MEKEFLVKRGDKESVVSETLARKLGRQVEVLGEVKESWASNGVEKLTSEEFAKKHISHDINPATHRRVRAIDKGFKTVYEIDKKSKPGQVRNPGEAYQDSTILENGKEVPFSQWRDAHTRNGS